MGGRGRNLSDGLQGRQDPCWSCNRADLTLRRPRIGWFGGLPLFRKRKGPGALKVVNHFIDPLHLQYSLHFFSQYERQHFLLPHYHLFLLVSTFVWTDSLQQPRSEASEDFPPAFATVSVCCRIFSPDPPTASTSHLGLHTYEGVDFTSLLQLITTISRAIDAQSAIRRLHCVSLTRF